MRRKHVASCEIDAFALEREYADRTMEHCRSALRANILEALKSEARMVERHAYKYRHISGQGVQISETPINARGWLLDSVVVTLSCDAEFFP